MRTLQWLLLVSASLCAHALGFLSRYDDSYRGSDREYYYPGGHQSRCGYGFRDNGNGRCIDVDECTKGRVIQCGLNADCFNRRGSFDCLCRPGFKKTGHKTCLDINECWESLDLCASNENCLNTIGSYNCYCKAGYVRKLGSKNCKKIAKSHDDHDDYYPRPYPLPYHPGDYDGPYRGGRGHSDGHADGNGYPAGDGHPDGNGYPQGDGGADGQRDHKRA